jgi:hypothetical protein
MLVVTAMYTSISRLKFLPSALNFTPSIRQENITRHTSPLPPSRRPIARTYPCPEIIRRTRCLRTALNRRDNLVIVFFRLLRSVKILLACGVPPLPYDEIVTLPKFKVSRRSLLIFSAFAST